MWPSCGDLGRLLENWSCGTAPQGVQGEKWRSESCEETSEALHRKDRIWWDFVSAALYETRVAFITWKRKHIVFDVFDDDRKTSNLIARHVEHVHGAQQACCSHFFTDTFKSPNKGAGFKNKRTKKKKNCCPAWLLQSVSDLCRIRWAASGWSCGRWPAGPPWTSPHRRPPRRTWCSLAPIGQRERSPGSPQQPAGKNIVKRRRVAGLHARWCLCNNSSPSQCQKLLSVDGLKPCFSKCFSEGQDPWKYFFHLFSVQCLLSFQSN